MAIDWKTIISEFDGKPTLLQAIGKLRKAVEDETITIQQAQAEIAKLESQQKADEALITTAQSTADEAKINAYNASQKGDQALGKATAADTKAQAADTKAQAADTKAQAADTKAQQALDLATKKLYMHFISITTGDPDYDRGNCQTVFYSYNSTPAANYLQLDQMIGEVGVDWYLPINGDVAKQVNGQWSIVGTTTLYESGGNIRYFEQANPTKTGFVSLRDTAHTFYDDVYEVR